MKIGIVVPGFSADDADWCIPAQRSLVREMAHEHNVHVVTVRYPYRRGQYAVDGATVHAMGGALAGGGRRVPFLLRAIAALVREGGFDAIHGMWADEPGFVAATAARLLRVPSVVSLLGGELVGLPDIGYGSQLSRINRLLVKVSLDQATRVTAGSSYLRRLARSTTSEERLLSLPIGVDTGLFRAGRPPSGLSLAGEVKLLHAGSLVAVKDQETLLQAVALAAREVAGLHLHIAGEGPLRGCLEEVSASLGIGDCVTFHGRVPHEKMPSTYRAADLCVLSSRHEGQELATLEAAACGRATVGTAVGVLPDLAPGARAVPVGDAEALAAALVEILSEPGRPAAMGEISLAKVRLGYTLEKTVSDLFSLYSALGENR